MIRQISLAGLLFLGFAGCSPEAEPPQVSLGDQIAKARLRLELAETEYARQSNLLGQVDWAIHGEERDPSLGEFDHLPKTDLNEMKANREKLAEIVSKSKAEFEAAKESLAKLAK